jgi:hypothetical protein
MLNWTNVHIRVKRKGYKRYRSEVSEGLDRVERSGVSDDALLRIQRRAQVFG